VLPQTDLDLPQSGKCKAVIFPQRYWAAFAVHVENRFAPISDDMNMSGSMIICVDDDS